MITLLFFLLAIALLAVGWWLEERSPNRRRDRVISDLHRANRQLDAEYRKARQAMNDAANQSWRNIIENDRG